MAIDLNNLCEVAGEFNEIMKHSDVQLPEPREVGAARFVVLSRLLSEGSITEAQFRARMAEFRGEFGVR
jgi:hypothetical protein